MNYESFNVPYEIDEELAKEFVARVKNELEGNPSLSTVSAFIKILNQKYSKGASELSKEAFSAYLVAIEDAIEVGDPEETFQSRAEDLALLRDMEETKLERGGDPED
jgi:hypothetical protein